MRYLLLLIIGVLLFTSCTQDTFDIVIRNGTVYDGTGKEGEKLDVAINGARIVKNFA